MYSNFEGSKGGERDTLPDSDARVPLVMWSFTSVRLRLAGRLSGGVSYFWSDSGLKIL